LSRITFHAPRIPALSLSQFSISVSAFFWCMIRPPQERRIAMFVATKDRILPTAMVGSFPRPSWFTESLRGRPFKVALGDSLYREQYTDAVACYINEQERAGLDILTDGDSRFDLEVGG